MRLKKLELTGFKSFAKHTALDLPGQISAIVGPNGSGKSNIVEAIRWALGEQSFKTIRGKKSEDFIFNGSPSVSQMSKASVVLIFDLAEKTENFGYGEARICRKVYRDGANEYLINDTQVRLKDIIETLSKLGLGTSSHHIISQGEADRILSASSKEKREIFEDALGLKIFQIRRQEAEKKLQKTEENISQVGSLQKEIQPHLKFLKKQAEKVEKSMGLHSKLKDLCCEYFSKEENFINKESTRLADLRNEPLDNLKAQEAKIKNLKEKLREAENVFERNEFKKIENEIDQARIKRVSLERDLGRLEGMIELQEARQKEAQKDFIERSVVEKFLEKISSHLKEGFAKEVFGKIEKAVADFSSEIKIKRQAEISDELENLKKRRSKTSSFLESARTSEENLSVQLAGLRLEAEKSADSRRASERELYSAEILASNLKNSLKSFEIEEEKLKSRKEELEAEKKSAIHFVGGEISTYQGSSLRDPKDDPWEIAEREQLRREIERLKIKLEDSEGIGEEVLKEYQQVKARDDFFEKELGDLERAAKSLADLMKELEEKIDHDFQKGISAINKEFQNFFNIMFGGGGAELKLIKIEKRKKEILEDEIAKSILSGERLEEDLSSDSAFVATSAKEAALAKEEGLEISVNLPRKRIKSLDMLSGGERALTSIALLFAMTQVHPPPFLVLDETDATLDESNSQKYAKMLKDLSKKTQLLIVTHNRETMKQAGVLYGVTMGASGTSQILSIKFEEAEELAEQDKT